MAKISIIIILVLLFAQTSFSRRQELRFYHYSMTLDFNRPSSNLYSYKMEGVDPDWVVTDASRRYASYTDLDPGK